MNSRHGQRAEQMAAQRAKVGVVQPSRVAAVPLSTGVHRGPEAE